MWVKLFGFWLAGGVVLTSLAIAWFGVRWQRIEALVYAGEKRPGWFWLVSLLVVGLYLAAPVTFFSGPKTWAGWLLMLVIPMGWLLKAGLVILNPQGRQKVSAIEGDQAWKRVALARLPAALILGLLAWFA
jgi:hypothetical protein